MNKLDLGSYSPYKAHRIDTIAGVVIRGENGAQAVVLLNCPSFVHNPQSLIITIWDNEPAPIINYIPDSYDTIEEWCSEYDYDLLHVFENKEDYVLTVGELYNESGSR